MIFCTLFDINYLYRGLALLESIIRVTDDYSFYIMAMDRACNDALKSFNLPNTTVECIEDNYSDELILAKSNRSRAEFCWTCGSYVTFHFLTKYNLSDITYLDSDLMFMSSPKVIFDELKEKNASVGLSPHFIPHNAFGKYCVQYCYFKNDANGMNALTWWKNECLKWCYSRIEDGKYGDQLYLDQMPSLFQNVVDIENRGAGMAYWNQFNCHYSVNGVRAKGTLFPFVYYHFSGFRFNVEGDILSVSEYYEVNQFIRGIIVESYIRLLSKVYEKYLGVSIKTVSYNKKYGKVRHFLNCCIFALQHFEFWHRFYGLMMKRKYSVRHKPYSEDGLNNCDLPEGKYFNINYRFILSSIFSSLDESVKFLFPSYICVADGNILQMVHRDKDYRKVINGSLFSICDSSWVPIFIKWIYGLEVKQYCGSQIFKDIIEQRKYRMYFLGTKRSILDPLKERLSEQYDPKINDMVFEELPFRDVNDFDYSGIAEKINNDNPDIIWISLGAPKQEIFMSKLKPYLKRGVMIAVGAAFKFYSGVSEKRAPEWMIKHHIEFIYRITQEPGKQISRCWKIVSALPGIIKEEKHKKRNTL